jgi:C1A family cysteine protease
MATIASIKGKGWRKDFPDFRDNTSSTNKLSQKQKTRGAKKPVSQVLEALAEKGSPSSKKNSFTKKKDLRQSCSPIEDQGNLNSCTAHAGVGLYEYFEGRASEKTPSDWFHTGLVTAVRDSVFETIEGNTNEDGSHNGIGVFRRTRNFMVQKLDVFSIEPLV